MSRPDYYERTNELRNVLDSVGRTKLQQKWVYTAHEGVTTRELFEWRDVPGVYYASLEPPK